jgi:hypothetical protein
VGESTRSWDGHSTRGTAKQRKATHETVKAFAVYYRCFLSSLVLNMHTHI